MSSALPSIAFFMHDLSAGGVERMRLRLAGGLAAQGHAVTIIVQSARGPLKNEVPHDVDLVELGRRHTWSAIGRLAAILRKRRPDIMVSSLDHNNIAALVAKLVAGRATKVIICQHNTLSAEVAASWRYRVVPLLYRVLSGLADGVIAVSEGVAEDLAVLTGISRECITVIYNPIVSDTVDALPPNSPHAWLSERAVPTFLFVGRLVLQKDPALLLRAFALRLLEGPARLIFLGDGPQLITLQKQAFALGIEKEVYFAGFTPDPLPWMAHAAALVLTSRFEGFGNVIVEALSCGTPVIATDCPHGPKEILAEGQFGSLVPIGNHVALAAAMAEDVRVRFPAEKLRQRASEYSTRACIARHQSLFGCLPRVPDGRIVFGLKFSSLDALGVCSCMLGPHGTKSAKLVITPNLDHIRMLRYQPEFAAACRSAEIVCPDGFPVALVTWSRGVGRGSRVTGCEIFHAIAEASATNFKTVLVVVENAATQRAMQAWAVARGLDTRWHAVVAPEDILGDVIGRNELLARIWLVKADLLIVTLGAPVSEIFVHRHRGQLPPCWVLCCGQAVRVELGLERRAPAAWQKLNLEWAWRLLREPRRLGPRYLRDVMSVPRILAAGLRIDVDLSRTGKRE